MRVPLFSIILLFLFAGSALAAVPKKKPIHRYKKLWEDSIFTSDPIVVKGNRGPNPLDDYTLASVCQLREGWHVVLINKKERHQRILIRPGEGSEDGFKVVAVKNPQTREAKVEIQAGDNKAWVTFEREFLTIKPAVVGSTAKGTKPRRHANLPPPIPGFNKPKVRRIPSPDDKQNK